MGASGTEFQFEKKHIEYIQNSFTTGWKFKLAMLTQLPLGFWTGLKVHELGMERCKVSVKYKRLNKNPFRSTFWAVLGMAAEMSSGAMVMMYTYKQKPSIATIITAQSAEFYKKATGRTTFVCESGKDIAAAVESAVLTGDGVEVVCPMKGYSESGELVCEFKFTWSFKARSRA